MGKLRKNSQAKNIHKDITYVYYDFENTFDTRTILLTMKNQLVKQGFEFPLFETGNFFYNLTIDKAEVVDAPKIQNALSTTAWLRDILSAADFFLPGANALDIVTTKIFDVIYRQIGENKILLEEMKNVRDLQKIQITPMNFINFCRNFSQRTLKIISAMPNVRKRR